MKTPLLGMTLAELKEVVRSLGMPAFTGGQIAKWIYGSHVRDIAEMTNISKANREKLAEQYCVGVMENIDADAFVFDPFSNPNIPMIRERLLPFIDRMVKAHPGKPLIFQRTIYWERENFNTDSQKEFGGRRALSDSLMAIACKKYKDVYYIKPDAALHNGESSTADGVHPNDNGYSLWEKSIEKPIMKILKKYGIRK